MSGNIQMLRADSRAAFAFHAVGRLVFSSQPAIGVNDSIRFSEELRIVQDFDIAGDGQFQRTGGEAVTAAGTLHHRNFCKVRPELAEDLQFFIAERFKILHQFRVVDHLFHVGNSAENGIHSVETGGKAQCCVPVLHSSEFQLLLPEDWQGVRL